MLQRRIVNNKVGEKKFLRISLIGCNTLRSESSSGDVNFVTVVGNRSVIALNDDLPLNTS
jgi:hypothetical protein